MYDFLLVIKTNLPPILHHFRDIAFDTSKIAIFGYSLASNPLDEGFVHYIIVSDISVKSREFGLHMCRRKFGHIFNHF